ncbi:MAG: hypothetical protein ACLQVI_15120 [Polyangiaceae bacterium]
MRRRYRVSYATAACAGTGIAIGAFGIASCVSNQAPPPPGGTTFPDGATADTAAPSEDSGIDTGFDAGATDTGTPAVDAADAADAADATPPCAPGSVAGFVLPAYIHSYQSPDNPCETRDNAALAASCAVDDSTFESCSTYPAEAVLWGTSSQCTACLLAPEYTLPQDAGEDAAPPPTYGAAIQTRVTVPNIAGCIELSDTSAAGLACAMAVQAAWRCEEFACNPTCPVVDNPSETAYFACTQAAATSVCKSYADPAAACLAAEVDAGVETAQLCLTQAVDPNDFNSGGVSLTGPAAQFFNVAEFFCNS